VQSDVVPDPDKADRFVGLRVSSEYRRQMTENTEWRSNLVLDGNGDDSSDVRADWTNSMSVSMNEHLGLKTSIRTTFDNEPALRRVPLRSPEGERAGTVLIPRDELDRVFTVALVVTF
jgi:putative salt-induced outer membrane protein YdiY